MRLFELAALASLVSAPARCAEPQVRVPTLNPIALDVELAKDKPPKPFEGVTKKAESKTNYFLPTGFSIGARLENEVVSYNVASPCIAVVDRDVAYLGRVVIPSGTRFIGTAAVEKSHDRILVSFNDIVFPSGDEVPFSGMALSLDGSAGIAGKVETFKDSAVANTVLRAAITGTQSALMYSGISPIAAGATQGLSNEAAQELDDHRRQVTVRITVPADTGIRIYVNQRLEY